MGKMEISKKALLSWSRLCSPSIIGGLNITSIAQWNKAAVCKLLWDLSRKMTNYGYYGLMIIT